MRLWCPRIGLSIGRCSRVGSVWSREEDKQPEGMYAGAAHAELLSGVVVELDWDSEGV